MTLLAPPDTAWMAFAACCGCDPNLFHPERTDPNSDARQAKAVCAGCEVRNECLEHGMGEQYGIWGGMTADERKRARNQR